MSTTPPVPSGPGTPDRPINAPDPAHLEALIRTLRDFIAAVEWIPGRPIPPRMIARGRANRLERALVAIGITDGQGVSDDPSESGLVGFHLRRALEDLAGVVSRTGMVLVGCEWRQPVGSVAGPLFSTPVETRRLRESLEGLSRALATTRGRGLTPKVRERPPHPVDPLEDIAAAVVEVVTLAEVEDADLESADPSRRMAIVEALKDFSHALSWFWSAAQAWRDRPGGADLEMRFLEANTIVARAMSRGGWHAIGDGWVYGPLPGTDMVRLTPAEARSLGQLAERAEGTRGMCVDAPKPRPIVSTRTNFNLALGRSANYPNYLEEQQRIGVLTVERRESGKGFRFAVVMADPERHRQLEADIARMEGRDRR